MASKCTECERFAVLRIEPNAGMPVMITKVYTVFGDKSYFVPAHQCEYLASDLSFRPKWDMAEYVRQLMRYENEELGREIFG